MALVMHITLQFKHQMVTKEVILVYSTIFVPLSGWPLVMKIPEVVTFSQLLEFLYFYIFCIRIFSFDQCLFSLLAYVSYFVLELNWSDKICQLFQLFFVLCLLYLNTNPLQFFFILNTVTKSGVLWPPCFFLEVRPLNYCKQQLNYLYKICIEKHLGQNVGQNFNLILQFLKIVKRIQIILFVSLWQNPQNFPVATWGRPSPNSPPQNLETFLNGILHYLS